MGQNYSVRIYRNDNFQDKEAKSKVLKSKIENLNDKRENLFREIVNLIPEKKNKIEEALLKKLLNDLDDLDKNISNTSESLSEALEKEFKDSQDVGIAYGTFIPFYNTTAVDKDFFINGFISKEEIEDK